MILTPDTYNEQDNFIKLFEDCVDEVVVNQYSERGQEIKQLSKDDIDGLRKLNKRMHMIQVLMIKISSRLTTRRRQNKNSKSIR